MSLRGIVAYKVQKNNMAAKLPITIFTGPVADLYLKHNIIYLTKAHYLQIVQ